MSVAKARIVGLSVILLLWAAARSPQEFVLTSEVKERFSFESTTLDNQFGITPRQTREVHRDLRRIAPWISSVGAAAAMGDIDGNLKPDDVCYVDTRINQVVVAPLLTNRYPAFRLPVPSSSHAPHTIAPMGCLIADLNEDGLPDLIVYYWGRSPVAFLRVDHGIAASEEAPNAEIYIPFPIGDEQRWYTNAALLADVNGDGHLDLVIGNYFCDGGRILDNKTNEAVCPHPVMQDSMSRAFNGGTNRILLWDSGNGGAQPNVTFLEAPNAFSPEVSNGWTLAIGAQDLNGDGLPDFYFANDFGPDRLLVNCSHALQSFGQTRAQLGCFPLDGPVSFRLVEGKRTFSKPRSKVLGQDSFKGMGVDFADINNDGIPDMYVSNITEKWALQESQFLFVSSGQKIDTALVQRGVAPFVDESEAYGVSRSGWAWDAKLADFDNDGKFEALQAVGFVRGRDSDTGIVWRKSCWAMLQELATANDGLLKYPEVWFHMEQKNSSVGCDLSGNSRRNPFFVMRPSGHYVDVAMHLDHLLHGQMAPTRGLAIGDADQDGRLDYIEAKQFSPPEFHHNTSHAATQNSFIGFSPRFIVNDPVALPYLVKSNGLSSIKTRSRPAVGARVSVLLSDGRTFSSQVDGGNGHSGKRSPDIHIGLGNVKPRTTAEVAVTWYSERRIKTIKFNEVEIGTHFTAFLQP